LETVQDRRKVSINHQWEVVHELLIGTKVGDLAWCWTAYWPLHCIISLNLVNLRSNT